MFNGENEVACSLYRIRQLQCRLLKILKHSQCSELPTVWWAWMSLPGSALAGFDHFHLVIWRRLFKLSIHGPAGSSLYFSYRSRVQLMSYLIFSEKELFIFISRAMLLCSEGIFPPYKFCGHRAVILSSHWICLVKSTCWTWFKEYLCMKEPVFWVRAISHQ